MIVVDADVTSYFWIRQDPFRAQLADRMRALDDRWAVPTVWVSEFRNVLASYITFRRFPLDDARRIAMVAEEALARTTIPVTSEDVLRLVAESGCTAYDCEYIAASRGLRTKLVTGDRKLVEAFPETAVTMEEFVGGA